MDRSFLDLSQGIFHVIITNLILSSFRFIRLLKFLFPWLGVSHGSEFAPFSFHKVESCISFYSLLVIPLINCPIKIKYYHNISRAQSHLILRELLWHASLVLSITRYMHTEYQSIRSVNRVDRRPPEIYTWNRQWPLMKQKLGEIIGADASTFCLWHSDCDPYFFGKELIIDPLCPDRTKTVITLLSPLESETFY